MLSTLGSDHVEPHERELVCSCPTRTSASSRELLGPLYDAALQLPRKCEESVVVTRMHWHTYAFAKRPKLRFQELIKP